MAKKKVSRRKFMVRTLLGGGGLLLGTLYLGRNPLRRKIYDFVESEDILLYGGNTQDPQLWFEISPENRITLFSPKVEMGQGTFTALVQIAADELEVGLEQIEIKHAESASGNLDQVATGGSTSVASLWEPLRELAATLREMLRSEGAKKLGVTLAQCRAENGKVTAAGQTLTYGEIVAGVTQWELPETPELKPVSSYQYVGKPIPRVDLKDKVMGAPIYGMDAALPGMLYGSVLRSDKIGATLKSVDTTKAEKMPGVVRVVVEEDFVGVVAQSHWEAEKAKLALVAVWETQRSWNTDDIEAAIQVGQGDKMIVQKEGRASKLLSKAEDNGTLITAEFASPLGAHAQLEPNGAVAHVEAEKATIILSTQVVKLTRKEVAARIGLKESQVNIIPTYLGGGFGRRLHTPNAMQAAVLSKVVGKPVKCFLNRKEEFQKDTFRPPTHHLLKACLDENGRIQAMEHNYASGDVLFNYPLDPGLGKPVLGADMGSMRGGRIQYRNIPNYRAISWHTQLPFATSWWRSLGLLANTFAIESFMDELAERAGKDPIAFRLEHLQEDEAGRRLKKVIEVAQELSGYPGIQEGGRAMGFACSTDMGTPVALVVEVIILDDEITVEKATMAIDPGLAINPDQVKAQCEGSILMGMSAALFEKMVVENSELKPTIYGPYKMAQLRHAPKEITVEIINGTGTPGAVGEPPLGPVGAAIANAVYRATGLRLRKMPLAEAFREALG